jgi:hypothetical protein
MTPGPHFSVHYEHPAPAQARLVKHRVFIDNRDRFDKPNTSPFDFRVNAADTGVSRFENVVSVELKALSFPKIANENYVILDSFELGDHIEATNSGAHRSYNIGYFDNDTLATGSVKTLKSKDMAFDNEKVFNPPIAQLDRFSFTFKKHGGNVVQLSDVASNANVSLCLDVTTDVRRGV